MLRAAVVVVAAVVLAAGAGCVKPLLACSVDAQCPAATACVDGACVHAPGEGEGEGAEGEGGEGEGAEGEGGEGEGEGGEGEGGEGEGEGCPTGEIVRTFQPDLDGDGFTGPPAQLCAGDATPQGYSLTANLAPIFLVQPAHVAGNNWTNVGNVVHLDGSVAKVDTRNDAQNATLTMSGFTCDGAPTAVTGLVVHVTGGMQDSTPRMVSTLVTVTAATTQQISQATTSTDAWPAQASPFDTFTLGSAQSTFGLVLTAADVCDPGFAIHLQLASLDGNRRTALVDAVQVEVFGGPDCDDGDATLFSPQRYFPDGDGDGHGDPASPVAVCGLDDTVPPGLLVNGDDCDDTSSDVFPGQTAFFTAPAPDGTFDYDCSGTDDPQPIGTASGCGFDSCSVCNFTSGSTTGTCGMSVSHPDCDGNCADTTSSTTQACR